MATAGNDTLNAARYGQTATWDGLGGIDTLYFDPRANSGIKFSMDSSGFIHVDSTSAASSYHFKLINVERVIYAGKTYDLTKMVFDSTPPVVSAFNPTDGATGVAVNANIVVTFNEAIKLGTGSILIKNGNGVVIENYVVAATVHPNLSISGAVLTINPNNSLANFTGYTVEFSAGSIKDLAGNSYAGTTSYNFTTTDMTVFNGTAVADTLTTGGSSVRSIMNGMAGNDTITGGTGNDTLDGGAGNDILDGGAGADSMSGGLGGDTYVVDSVSDTVSETSTVVTEIDTVKSAVDFTLGANLEKLILTAAGHTGTGNALNNTLTGSTGADTLDGGAGKDTLIGGTGADTYIVDSITDVVTEATTAVTEIDKVQSSVTWTLGVNLEQLTLTGGADINGTGNTLANLITGNSGNNLLTGGTGNDTLSGGLGADTLDGGVGADSLAGGDGNDIYKLDNIADSISETGTGTSDTAIVGYATAVAKTLSLGVDFTNIENITITGTGLYSLAGDGNDNILIGNGSANTVTGGAGADTLNGGIGADTMIGGDGNDAYVVDNVGDKVTETTADSVAGGVDHVQSSVSFTLGANVENLTLTGVAVINGTGNADANILTGNGGANKLIGLGGNDTLDGGLGADSLAGGDGDDLLKGGLGLDTLTGGIGSDVFRFDFAPSTANADHITDFATGTDFIHLSQTLFVNAGVAGVLAANEFVSGAGHAANDTHHVLYDTNTGGLYYNADGAGLGAPVLIATLDGHPTLAASDILLY